MLVKCKYIRIGKYGIGTKMIILPTKALRRTPGYPKVLRSAKISLMP